MDWKENALNASRTLNLLGEDEINAALLAVADEAVAQADRLLEANALDLAAMDAANPLRDRLLLTRERIEGIAADMRHVASLPSPLGRVLSRRCAPTA